eukprot:scaffold100511_cov25-Tisochrysis_lutea.AAC.1
MPPCPHLAPFAVKQERLRSRSSAISATATTQWDSGTAGPRACLPHSEPARYSLRVPSPQVHERRTPLLRHRPRPREARRAESPTSNRCRK